MTIIVTPETGNLKFKKLNITAILTAQTSVAKYVKYKIFKVKLFPVCKLHRTNKNHILLDRSHKTDLRMKI